METMDIIGVFSLVALAVVTVSMYVFEKHQQQEQQQTKKSSERVHPYSIKKKAALWDDEEKPYTTLTKPLSERIIEKVNAFRETGTNEIKVFSSEQQHKLSVFEDEHIWLENKDIKFESSIVMLEDGRGKCYFFFEKEEDAAHFKLTF